MKQVFCISDMSEGKYYLCYEIFNIPNTSNFGQKNIFIGKFMESEGNTLIGTLFNNIPNDNRFDWMLYPSFNCEDGIQFVFELTDQEVYRHVLLEDI